MDSSDSVTEWNVPPQARERVFSTDSSNLKFPVNKIADFEGGMKALYSFIGVNVVYPIRCMELELEGTVIVEFIVEKDGRVSNVEPLTKHKSCPEMNDEAIRVLKKTSGRWISAEHNGHKVRSKYRLPIRFNLE